MAGGKNGSRNGSSKKGSPRYSDRYGAGRPNPYTGYLPPGSAPAGQIYHPESLDMKKVSQMMTESADSLAAAASSRAVDGAEIKKQMDNENTTSKNTAPAARESQRTESDQSSAGGERQYSPSRKKKRGKKSGNGQRSMSDEQRQKLQSIQDEAAAEMITEVLSQTITDAADSGAQPEPAAEEKADSAVPGIAWKAPEPIPEEKEEGFDPARFEEAQVMENPFDENFLSQEEAEAASFVPPLDIFGGDEPEEQPEHEDDVSLEPESVDEAVDAEESADIAEEASESDADEADLAEQEDASKEDVLQPETEPESLPADDGSDEAVSDEDAVADDEVSSEEQSEESVREEESPASADSDEVQEDSDDTETEENDEDSDDADDGLEIDGVDWETPDEPQQDDDDDSDDDMIIVADGHIAVPEETERGLRVHDIAHDGDDEEITESDDPEDMLFVKKDRGAGSTTVFSLPEGVRLPTYIDDDEFLEQWLNEGEDMAIKDKKLRRRVSTLIGTITMLFAMVGFVWVIQYAFGALAGIGNTDESKDKYVEFITPVVMSEVQPFESWSGIPTEKLMQSAIFHVLLNMEDSQYKTDDTNKIVIPSGDIEDAIVRMYGNAASISADSLDILDGDDVYYSDTDDCFHVAATGISGPQPEIISISKKGSEVTLMVGYLDETGLETSEGGYYQTMQFVVTEIGDTMYLSAVRAVAENK